MTSRNPRICADCRHCEPRRALLVLTEEFCRHPKAVDLVTGKAVWRARQLRDPGSRLCGAAGRLWEAQEAAPAPTLPADPVDAAVDAQRASVGEYLANVHQAFPDPKEWIEHHFAKAMPEYAPVADPAPDFNVENIEYRATIVNTIEPFAKAIRESRR